MLRFASLPVGVTIRVWSGTTLRCCVGRRSMTSISNVGPSGSGSVSRDLKDEKVTFNSLHVQSAIWPKLPRFGFKEPTPIQKSGLTALWRGVPKTHVVERGIPPPQYNILIQSPTGTGKTLAYLLSVLSQVDNKIPALQAAIIVPTRELAIQIGDLAKSLAKGGSKGRKTHPLLVERVAGRNQKTAERLKKNPVHVLISPPATYLHLLNDKAITNDKLKWLVLEETDFLVQDFFAEQTERILKRRANAQVVCVSAWITPAVQQVVRQHLRRVKLCTETGVKTLSVKDDVLGIPMAQLPVTERQTHKALVVSEDVDDKPEVQARAIASVFLHVRPQGMLCFFENPAVIPAVIEALQSFNLNVPIYAMHSGVEKDQRKQALRMPSKQRRTIILASDLLSRGVDVPGLTHVVNMEVPQSANSYLHRAGRVGRLSVKGVSPGVVFTMVPPSRKEELEMVQSTLSLDIKYIESFKNLSRKEMAALLASRKTKKMKEHAKSVPLPSPEEGDVTGASEES